jgi:L-serine dehydratase
MFVTEAHEEKILSQCDRIQIELFGSLGATGRGHSSDKAVILGLMGDLPQSVDMTQAKRASSK